MSIEKFVPWSAGLLCVALAACSGGGSSGGGVSGTIESAVQDLTLDPDGLTTVITFNRAVSGLVPGDFEADSGQDALSVSIAGDEVTVEWDARVTPAHQLRVSGIASISSAFEAVTTTDSAAPTFVITDADQVAGLGNDVITVQFSGARLIESEAEELDNWVLEVGGEELDLAGSTFALDTSTQTLTITTGSSGNLHASFTLTASTLHSVADVLVPATPHNGSATGDSSVPTLVSLEQNIVVDEYGRTLDITFSEAMDPLFSIDLANFGAASPDIAIGIEQPAENLLRVTFNNPMVPALNTVDLSGLVDAHGNAFVDMNSAITAGSTVVNDWDGDPELLAVSNQGGDQLVALFEQALDPDSAGDPTRWSLVIDPSGAATVVDLTAETFDYDLVTKTLTITLSDDFTNATEFTFAANLASAPLDVDGEEFDESFDGQVGGDAVAPTISEAKQKRGVDNSGVTIDVVFDEDLDESSAETLGNWGVTNVNVLSATLQSNLNTVRLVVDPLAVPGDETVACAGVTDLAGNLMTPVLAQTLISSDTLDPVLVSATATVLAGVGNDKLTVKLNDDMLESEIEDPANWSVESPIGTALDLSLATIDYRTVGRQTTLTFQSATGIDLALDDSFQVGLSTMRDLGGNTVDPTPLTGTVDGERDLPQLIAAWAESAALNTLHVRFSEPCRELDDIAGLTEYAVYDSLGTLKGYPLSVTVDADQMGAELLLGFATVPGSDVLDVSGVLDLAGNPLFAIDDATIEAEDTTEVALDPGQSAIVVTSGERNDSVLVDFAAVPSPWLLLDFNNYEVALLGTPVDLSAARFTQLSPTQVELHLETVDAFDFNLASSYDLSVSGLSSAQGLPMGAVSTENVPASGDTLPSDLPAGRARLDAANPTNAVLLEFDEALDPTAAVTAGNFENTTIGQFAVSAELLGYRTVRATFAGAIAIGDVIAVTVLDRAGNATSTSRAITSQDTSGPLVESVYGTAVAGVGGDWISITFDEQLDLVSALNPVNYTVTLGGLPIDLTGAELRWISGSDELRILLDEGLELDVTQTLNLQVSNVYDHSGLVMNPPADIFGAMQGDSTAPDLDQAFANYRVDAGGAVIEVLFDEAVDSSFAGVASNWTASGGQSVTSVRTLTPSWYRVTLGAALVDGDTLELSGVPDLAHNQSGTITVTPQL